MGAGAAYLLAVWIVFAVLSVLGIAAALLWAVRSGQFSRQDDARRLPLESGIPDDEPRCGQRPSAESSGDAKEDKRNDDQH